MPQIEIPETKYSYRILSDPTRDLKVVEINRNDGSRPYTILMHAFSSTGYTRLFQQLYSTSSWAYWECPTLQSDDTLFAKYLWKKLELPGEFDLGTLEFDLWMAPAVYRDPADQVLARKYGRGMVETAPAVVQEELVVIS